MPATIEIQGTTATIKDGQWTSKSKETAQFLNEAANLFEATPDMGDPDVATARFFAKRFNGKVIEEKPARYNPNTIY